VFFTPTFFLPQRRRRLFIIGVRIDTADMELNSGAQSVVDMAMDVYMPRMKLGSGCPVDEPQLATRAMFFVS
jgi:site-specific DNA-cytosine methylase